MPLTDVSIPAVKALFDANVFGVMEMVTAFVPLLKLSVDSSRESDRFAAIVNISSQSDRVPFPFKGAYAASKAALSAYGRTLSVELHHSGIRVLTVVTGYVASQLGRRPPPLPPPGDANSAPASSLPLPQQPVLPPDSLFQPMRNDLIRPSRAGERMSADEYAETVVAEVLKGNGRSWSLWWGTGWRLGAMRDWMWAGGRIRSVWLLTWLGEGVTKRVMLRQWPFWKLSSATAATVAAGEERAGHQTRKDR